jgi:hypothetical protein
MELSKPVPRLHADIVIALAVLGFCAIVLGLTFTFDTIPAALTHGMSAAAFPRLLLAVIAVLVLALAWSARGRADEVREPVPAMVYYTAAAMLAVMGVLWLAGFYVAAVAAIVGIGMLWGERRWALLLASGVGLAFGLYLLFTKGFGILLPRGLIGDWLA